jgi:hypothetical protein
MAGEPSRADMVYVIGMHRSGTSALTELLTQFGLRGPPTEDLVPASRWNAHGNQESESLNRFNNDLLMESGGRWSAPPVMEDGWEYGPVAMANRKRATALATSVLTASGSAWKDPRNCILLPFWRTVLRRPQAAVFVYRNPDEVATSLRSRNGFPLTHGLALWERYVRSAIRNLDGLPTLVVRFERLLETPSVYTGRVVTFLESLGMGIDAPTGEQAAVALDPGLRHHRPVTGPPNPLAKSQQDLLALLDDVEGAHEQWRPPAIDVEPGWVEDTLTLRRDFERIRREQRQARSGLRIRLAARRRGRGAVG